ncbi:MAG: hypothetical protein KGD60_11465 [Candidatus Thorarchaeota archaeon]|nr:hypothetical protein [Candidatus Thorarchaeota archaeon]
MNSEERSKQVDELLELLSKPLTRYILSVIAGVDPGVFVEPSEDPRKTSQDWKNSDS